MSTPSFRGRNRGIVLWCSHPPCLSIIVGAFPRPFPGRAKVQPIALAAAIHRSTERRRWYRTRVDYAVSERQLFPKAAVQPSTWQANANVALGSRQDSPEILQRNMKHEAERTDSAMALIGKAVKLGCLPVRLC